MVAHTDRVRSIMEATDSRVVRVGEVEGERRLTTAGRLASWRAAYAQVEMMEDGVAIDTAGAALLGVGVGDTVTHVGRS
jgi:arginine N-succinyltransferase